MGENKASPALHLSRPMGSDQTTSNPLGLPLNNKIPGRAGGKELAGVG